MILVTILLAGLVAFAIVLVARALALPRLRAAERVDAINAYGFAAPAADAAAYRSEPSVGAAPLTALASWIGDRVAQRVGVVGEQALRKELLAAGLYRMSPRLLLGYRALATLAFAAIGWLLGRSLPLIFLVPLVAYAGAMGWILTITAVRRRARFRMQEIDRALPDLIDLLVVTVEAGLGFGASLQVAVSRIPGPLAAEVRLTLQEQSMGSTTREALERMTDRVDTPAMRSFVRSIVQGETLGVPIGTIMRTLAGEMRVRRHAAAEEQARKAPTKLLFPLVFLILPALLVVLLGPPGIEIMDTLSGP
jgi:tight adherence protein C